MEAIPFQTLPSSWPVAKWTVTSPEKNIVRLRLFPGLDLMTRRQQIYVFLKSNRKIFFCDDCLAAIIGTRREYTNTITSVLALSKQFVKVKGICSNGCRHGKWVTRAI